MVSTGRFKVRSFLHYTNFSKLNFDKFGIAGKLRLSGIFKVEDILVTKGIKFEKK